MGSSFSRGRLVFLLVGVTVLVVTTGMVLTVPSEPSSVLDSTVNKTDTNSLNTLTARNFLISENLSIPYEKQKSYPTYRISIPSFNNATANGTIEGIYGDIINNETEFTITDEGGFRYYFRNATLELFPSGLILFESTIEESYYREANIEKESHLNNVSETKAFISKYAKDELGFNMSEFIYDTTYAWKKVNQSGEFIEYYVVYFKRSINDIGMIGSPFGGFHFGISPNGTIVTSQIYIPTITISNNTQLMSVDTAIKKIDDDFDKYKGRLLSGYSSYSLFNVEKVYGRVNGIISIGWKCDFYCGQETDKVSTIFIAS